MKSKSFAEGDDAPIPGTMGRKLGGCVDWDRQLGEILTKAFLRAYFQIINEQLGSGGGGGGEGSSDDGNGGENNNWSIPLSVVKGYFTFAWAGSGRRDITAGCSEGVNEGKGFSISYSFDSKDGGVGVGSRFVSSEEMEKLLTEGEGSGPIKAAAAIALTTSSADGPLPVGEIAGAVILTGAIAYDLSQRIYLTYTLRNSYGKIYAGRTSGYGNPYSIMWNRYSGHHMRSFGYADPELDVAAQGAVAYPAIRGREQQLIDFHGGIGSPNVGNSIRGVGYFTDIGQVLHTYSNLYFGSLAPYTGFWK